MEPSREAINLSGYVPMQFITEVEIGEHLGDEGRGQVSINDRPFILEWITHQIVPAELDQSQNVSGWFYQDGLYQLDWSLYEQARFWKGVPPMADAGFGSIRDGTWKKLPAPVSLPGNETLHCRIINRVERPAKFIVQVIWHGIQRGGQMSQVGV